MATTEIDARLAAYGFDAHVINTEVHVQARISSSCSRACSTPHEQNACSSSEKFGTSVPQVDQWVRVVKIRLRSLAQPQSDKVVLYIRHDMHHAGFACECAVVICRKSKRVEGSAGQCAVVPNRVPFSQIERSSRHLTVDKAGLSRARMTDRLRRSCGLPALLGVSL